MFDCSLVNTFNVDVSRETLWKEVAVIYLASPYSHASEAVRQQRFEAVCKQAAYLMAYGGFDVFSPIAHSHWICKLGNLPQSFGFWERLDRVFLEVCDHMAVLMLDGWEKSEGIQRETEIMKGMGKPVILQKPYWEGRE